MWTAPAAAPLGLKVVEVAVGLKGLSLRPVLSAVHLFDESLLELKLVVSVHE